MKTLRLLALLSAVLAASCAHTAKVRGVQEATTSYLSGGKKIVVETYLPASPGRHPAVAVLYGSGGLINGKGDMVAFARLLAQRGMAAYLIHYFDRTGTLIAGDKSIAADSKIWQATVKDGIDFISQQPEVNPRAIGLYGYSLGAFLSVGAATTDARIVAAAELSGGLFQGLKGHTRRFPPMLILHGSDDQRVRIKFAEELLLEARRMHARPAVHIYPGEGHSLSTSAAADATTRALIFLQLHLHP
ncbi:alpha/beta hydrolase family protein [Prosthecobacter sp.]|uniref:alpha/beta hydrolase family protein n=1 Tax=Prosthecobacter sp. TaxID=1965333 RepID=UPI003783350A